jgi:glycerophosphoryl diester phosphodiesterase
MMTVMMMILLLSTSSTLNNESPPSPSVKQGDSFIVIAHRGASAYLPEHTLDAATLAFMQGADYIEQDVVLSADGIPIVLHDIHIDTVTNVESLFPDRARDDGRFYAIDFTWAEIQGLFIHERQDLQGEQVYPKRYSGRSAFKIATLEQHISHIKLLNKMHGKSVGFYTEIKAPEWHLKEGKDITKLVFNVLEKHDLIDSEANIFIQSFYPPTLKRLKNEFGVTAPLVQLIAENNWEESSADYVYLRSPAGLAEIATYADGIGPWLPHLYSFKNKQQTSLLSDARALDLVVHPYTFRADDLPNGITSSDALLTLLTETLQVDGVFTDHPDLVLLHARTQTQSAE